jgi:hypothetical protein
MCMDTDPAFRTVRRLLGTYLALGVATLVVAVLRRDHPAGVAAVTNGPGLRSAFAPRPAPRPVG